MNNEPLYESRMDNRNFVPDGMVPGLRPAPPPPRNREYDGLDETMLYNAQRLQAQPQHRGMDDYYSSSNGGVYQQQQLARNAGLGASQAPYRGGPSPIGGQHAHLQQRLPPGLANLGGRPPLVHEPSPQQSYLGLSGGPAGLHSAHLNGLSQQQYNNNFGPAGNGGIGGAQLRALGGGPQMPEHISQHLPHGLPNNLDLRSPSQAQLLGHARGGGNFGQQQQSVAQLQALAMRQQHLQQQQQQQQLLQQQQQQQQQQSHLHLHAQHQHQHQQHAPHPNSQASDLMALLMGGGPQRD